MNQIEKELTNAIVAVNRYYQEHLYSEAAEYHVCRNCCTAQAWMNAKETVNCGA